MFLNFQARNIRIRTLPFCIRLHCNYLHRSQPDCFLNSTFYPSAGTVSSLAAHFSVWLHVVSVRNIESHYEMAGWHHRLDGYESEETLGVGDWGLACCDSWGRKESDTTERLNWTECISFFFPHLLCHKIFFCLFRNFSSSTCYVLWQKKDE